MAKKDKNKDNNNKGRSGVVYSTDPDFEYKYEEEEEVPEVAPNQQKLRVFIDRKQRGGKEVTLITGFAGPQSALEELGKFLKTKCGVGGSAKDGEIIVQGDHRERVVQLLLEKGFTGTKKAGG
ncbi:translation initiation factor [Haliscomenobacter hydrossis]|uniref:Translation initiation factor SUI1 n=1 Tax=Haliscomenobacter hydrossis (strain ATCC 27775 / DSM 1100 / LMG 10767 / O) TaxID=760192 RepID=F4KVZ0_HALH1|nr:translation initiation factor [Haliscomenobacter hydrossis]AEE48188.1 translation initiation factor SUI1 [Haliscomenobacter hydrossis DSM 1100]